MRLRETVNCPAKCPPNKANCLRSVVTTALMKKGLRPLMVAADHEPTTVVTTAPMKKGLRLARNVVSLVLAGGNHSPDDEGITTARRHDSA